MEKHHFQPFFSAELFLLSDLILSTVGLTGLPVLELFTLKTKFLFTLFAYCRFFFFSFISSAHAGFAPSSVHTKAKVVSKMNSTFVQHTQANALVINKRQLPNSTFIL